MTRVLSPISFLESGTFLLIAVIPIAARKSHEEALAVRKQTGDKQTAAETETALARLAIDEVTPPTRETVIRKCKEQFHQDQQADDELAASIVLIDALIAESKLPEAESEAERTKPLADKSGNALFRWQYELMSARAQGLTGHFAVASAQLERVLRSAHDHQFVGLEFETRLAMAELKNKAGQPVAARAEWLSLENAARKNGFGLHRKPGSFPAAMLANKRSLPISAFAVAVRTEKLLDPVAAWTFPSLPQTSRNSFQLMPPCK